MTILIKLMILFGIAGVALFVSNPFLENKTLRYIMIAFLVASGLCWVLDTPSEKRDCALYYETNSSTIERVPEGIKAVEEEPL